MHSLPLFVRVKGRPVILVGEGESADAKRRLLERAGALVVAEDAQATFAIVALDGDAAANAAVARLRARGVLVNAVDRPALCDFTIPAIVERDPVLIAISSGGASAGLAAALRQRLEALFPVSLGTLAQALYAARSALKARFPDPRTRRQAIATALAQHGALDPLQSMEPDAVTRWLSTTTTPASDNVTHIVLTSPDPDDLTLRAARLLSMADCVCYSVDVPPEILARARADAVRQVCTASPTHCDHGRCVYLSF